jgi:hypothetical protein
VVDEEETTWVECIHAEGPLTQPTEHRFRVNKYFRSGLTGPVHILVCDRCGMHLHATFDEDEEKGW